MEAINFSETLENTWGHISEDCRLQLDSHDERCLKYVESRCLNECGCISNSHVAGYEEEGQRIGYKVRQICAPWPSFFGGATEVLCMLEGDERHGPSAV